MKKIPRWSEVLATMEPEEKKDFLKWWTSLPSASLQFDMQPIVALSYQAGRKDGKELKENK